MIVGFIGLGSMGGPIAANLLGAGIMLLAFDVLPERVAPIVAAGVAAMPKAILLASAFLGKRLGFLPDVRRTCW